MGQRKRHRKILALLEELNTRLSAMQISITRSGKQNPEVVARDEAQARKAAGEQDDLARFVGKLALRQLEIERALADLVEIERKRGATPPEEVGEG